MIILDSADTEEKVAVNEGMISYIMPCEKGCTIWFSQSDSMVFKQTMYDVLLLIDGSEK